MRESESSSGPLTLRMSYLFFYACMNRMQDGRQLCRGIRETDEGGRGKGEREWEVREDLPRRETHRCVLEFLQPRVLAPKRRGGDKEKENILDNCLDGATK